MALEQTTRSNLMAGKTCLVTGATAGIGQKTALELAHMGADVVLAGRNEPRCAATVDEIRQDSGNPAVEYLVADLSSQEQVRRLAKEFKERRQHLNVLVNNAAWRARGDLLSIDEDLWQTALGVNLHAPFLTRKAVLPNMVRNNWGRIINYSGIAPFRGASGQGTLKMATEGLTRAIAQEYGRYNITANCIGPGSIAVARTPGQETGPDEGHGPLNIPVPRQGTVEECSAAVVFLASEQASYITGQNYLVNGGAYFH